MDTLLGRWLNKKAPEIKKENEPPIQIITISDDEKVIDDDSKFENSVCQHTLDWSNLTSFKDKDPKKSVQELMTRSLTNEVKGNI